MFTKPLEFGFKQFARRRLWPAALICAALGWSAAAWGQTAEPSQIRSALEQYRDAGALTVLDAPLGSGPFLEAFYRQRGYAPAWDDPEEARDLAAALLGLAADGLDGRDANASATLAAIANPLRLDPASYDLLLTDSLLRMLYLLHYGKVDPAQLDPVWNLSAPLLDEPAIEQVQDAFAEDSVAELVAAARPQGVYYRTFKSALASHREIAAGGGWGAVSPGPTIKPGDRSARVRELRLRLSKSGDFNFVGTGDAEIYDAALVEAVKAFQRRNGIAPDGVIGPRTLKKLNISVEERIAQIRINMERARWVHRSVDDDYLIVNIAGYYLKLIRDRQPVWETEVVVGSPFRKTPVFSGDMTYLELNPTWTATRNIAVNDILPNVKKDPGYLDRKKFQVVDARRTPIDRTTINWDQVTRRNLNFWFVQQPGPQNALGEVKFMFPNEHAVYLHDTPSRNLFEKTERTFSSGCIRVKDPLTLAALLLQNRQGWDRDAIDSVIASGATKRVLIERPLPVLLLYWTVDPDLSGAIRFYPDVYGRDAALAEAFAEPFPAIPF